MKQAHATVRWSYIPVRNGEINEESDLALSGILATAPFVFALNADVTKFVHCTPQESHWMEDPDAPGIYGKNVTGSASAGNCVMYAKVNPGAWINWRWHSNSQTLYVVSGTLDYEVKPQPRVKEQFFLAATVQNVTRLLKFLNQSKEPRVEMA